jgi:flavin-dependent dehydrogenase
MVSPRGEDRLNVGMMVSPHMLKGKESLRGLVKGFMDHLEKINRFDFSKAYSVSLMAGATHPTRLMAENIISDGLVLVGDGAWRPPVGTRWGCAGINNAIVTGKLAGVAVAEAIKEGNVSRRGLTRYVDRIEATLEGQKQKILEGRNYFHKLVVLSPQRQDKAMEEIGNHISSLHHYMRGALPLVGCLEPIKEWFRKEGLENA